MRIVRGPGDPGVEVPNPDQPLDPAQQVHDGHGRHHHGGHGRPAHQRPPGPSKNLPLRPRPRPRNPRGPALAGSDNEDEFNWVPPDEGADGVAPLSDAQQPGMEDNSRGEGGGHDSDNHRGGDHRGSSGASHVPDAASTELSLGENWSASRRSQDGHGSKVLPADAVSRGGASVPRLSEEILSLAGAAVLFGAKGRNASRSQREEALVDFLLVLGDRQSAGKSSPLSRSHLQMLAVQSFVERNVTPPLTERDDTIAHVKRLLVARQDMRTRDKGEARSAADEDRFALLPLVVLQSRLRRTASQRSSAIGRMDFISKTLDVRAR